MSDEDLERLLSGDERLRRTVIDKATHHFIVAIISQTIEWATSFRTRAKANQSLIGRVVRTYYLGADPHLSGIPLLLQTDKGFYVYKPRPVDLDYYYNEIVRLLVQCGLKHPPGVLTVHNLQGYGFLSFVNSRLAPIGLEASDFRSIGTVLAIVYALAGTDFHYENIVFSEDGVFLIDLEGLLQPQVKTTSDPAHGSISVLNTGILPARILAGPSFDFDPSILGSKKFHFVCAREVALQSFLEGFTDAYNCILSNRCELLTSSIYASLRRTRSRFIVCQTVDYYRALARHIRSARTIDGSLGSTFLEQLRSSDGLDDPFLKSEKHSLSRLCIPVFYSSNKDSAIQTENGRETLAKVDKSGFDSSFDRIANGMSPADLNRQTWFIECSFEYHAMNFGYTLDVCEPIFETVRPETACLVQLIGRLSRKLSQYLKVDSLGAQYAVVPIFGQGQWSLYNRALDFSENRIVEDISTLAAQLVEAYDCCHDLDSSGFEHKICSIVDRIRHLLDKEARIINFVQPAIPDADRIFRISIDDGPCAYILDEFTERGKLSFQQCSSFISSFNFFQQSKQIRYGGIFATHCLYMSFGLPCLLITFCAIVFSMMLADDG